MLTRPIERSAPQSLVLRLFEEVFNRQDARAAGEVISPDFVAHHPAFPEGIRGVEGMLQMVGMFRAGFPNLNYTVMDEVAQGQRVAARWVATGTHQGTFLGIPATGRTVHVLGTDIFRAEGGQLAEAWVCSDFFGLFQQLGAFPPPPPPKK